jgi:hypothetical protein
LPDTFRTIFINNCSVGDNITKILLGPWLQNVSCFNCFRLFKQKILLTHSQFSRKIVFLNLSYRDSLTRTVGAINETLASIRTAAIFLNFSDQSLF